MKARGHRFWIFQSLHLNAFIECIRNSKVSDMGSRDQDERVTWNLSPVIYGWRKAKSIVLKYLLIVILWTISVQFVSSRFHWSKRHNSAIWVFLLLNSHGTVLNVVIHEWLDHKSFSFGQFFWLIRNGWSLILCMFLPTQKLERVNFNGVHSISQFLCTKKCFIFFP